MAYSASALSFMLQNLGKPVILTGAIIPLAGMHLEVVKTARSHDEIVIVEIYNDAARNLVFALLLAGKATACCYTCHLWQALY